MQFVKPYGIIALTILIGILKFGISLIPLLVAYAIDDIILADGIPYDERISMLIQVLIIFV